jgi:hypothetical protein
VFDSFCEERRAHRRWLRDLGLECYADAFEANAIDREVLSEVTRGRAGEAREKHRAVGGRRPAPAPS